MKYERLTETKKINEFCSTIECGEHCEDCYVGKLYERLAELEDKIENGTLIELPCKVGSTIYRIDYMGVTCSHENAHYDEYWCRNCRYHLNGDCDWKQEPYIFVIKDANARDVLGNAHLIGSRAFLTKAEAEKKLKELKGE